jgi:regulatory protein
MVQVDPSADDDPPGDPESVARTICLRLLDIRPRSRAELATALRRRGVPDEPASAVLDRFAELRLIDDAGLAESFALARHTNRGVARPVIAAQLRRRGIDDESIGAALAQIDPASERAAARSLALSRLGRMSGLDSQTQVRRLMGLLGRRGYSAGVSAQAIREAFEERDEALDTDALVVLD